MSKELPGTGLVIYNSSEEAKTNQKYFTSHQSMGSEYSRKPTLLNHNTF